MNYTRRCFLSGARYIRASTIRSSICYRVLRCRQGELQTTVITECLRRRRGLAWGQKGVVYCRSRTECKEIAETLGCAYYHAGVTDRQERLEHWLQHGGFLVATSALGTGVDFPGIVLVIHMDLPYGMMDFAQESGRAGRAGERVESVIVIETGVAERVRDNVQESRERRVMAEMIITTGCRRAVMSDYLDGRPQRCEEIGAVHCDGCGEGLSVWTQAQVMMAEEQERVMQTLDLLQHGCTACWVQTRKEDGFLHGWQDCSGPSGLRQPACDEFRRQIRYQKDSHTCFRCGFSQKLCRTREGNHQECQWPNIMIPFVRAIGGSGLDGLLLLERAGWQEGKKIMREEKDKEEGQIKSTEDWQRYGEWLGQRHQQRIWGEWMSNSMAVLIKGILYLTGFHG